MAQRRKGCSTKTLTKQIDAAVAGWVEQGLVSASGWVGAPILSTPIPSGGGIWFDVEAAERVVRFFLLLHQLIGRWAGREFKLLDWQVRHLVAPVFGLKWADGRRVIRTVWFEIPRKNGKSTICSGLGLYLFMADREAGAEVYAAAGSRQQAGIVFRAARGMAEGSPTIAAKLGRKGIQRSLLEHPVTRSIFRALSSDGDLQHGLNVHGALIDEVHVHKKPDLIDALETGTGSREQPLIVFITTADDGEDGSIYATKREYLEGVCSGTIGDRTFFGVVFGADQNVEGFDAFSEATIAAANPGAGITVTWDYLRSKAAEAQQSPAQLNRYLRLALNVRTKQTTRWLPLDAWDVTGQLIDDAEWHGKRAYGGLDLSTSTDFTAFALKVRGDDERGDLLRVMCWLPEERFPVVARLTGAPLVKWRAEGWLRGTEGNVVDYRQVRADIEALVDQLGVDLFSIAYDPWNASETSQLLGERFEMVPCRQGYATLSAPAKSLERLIVGSTPEHPLIRTGGNPLLRWMADCVEVRSDDAGNIKPVKPDRAKSSKRIDGIVAAIMAEREDMADEDEESSGDAYMAALLAKHTTAS